MIKGRANISYNHIERTQLMPHDYTWGNWRYFIQAEDAHDAVIRGNTILEHPDSYWLYQVMGIRAEFALVDSNYLDLILSGNCNDLVAIHDDRNSDITNNTIIARDGRECGTWDVIRSYSDGDDRHSISNNTITTYYRSGGDNIYRIMYLGSNKDVENNTINILDGNTVGNAIFEINGDNVTLTGNTIYSEATAKGIYVNDKNNIQIYNNSFTFTSSAMWLDAYSSDIDVHHNLVITNSGRGMEIHNQSGGGIYNNTLISSSGDYGIHVSQLTDIPIKSNIIVGFQNGVYYENDIETTNIQFNDLYNISNEPYSGSAMHIMIGNHFNTTLTYSGDTVLTDIFANMNVNPQFAMPDEGNYELQLISPCINNGDPSILDPDGTGSDIGAYYKDASIEEDVYGCMDETACNYNAGATLDNGDCTTATTWYWDEDGDGLGFIESTEVACDQPPGFVSNSDDSDPQCATNDTDECGICAGGNLDQDCNGDCFGEATTDDCEVCSGGLSEHEANSDQDCNDECFGGAFIDGCSICVGGSTELEACPEDCNAVFGGDAFWDDCQVCSGGDTEHEANSDMDCAGVCYGDNIGDSFDGCCLEESIDDCGECDGNGWDMCGEPPNYEQWGYGIWGAIVTDIPNDQGGFVMLEFNRSFYDTDSLRTIEIYTIERWEGEFWTSLHSISAYAQDTYHTIVMTAADSSSTTDGLTLFRVIANMDEGNFENNEEIWGYSVDNISPIVPNQMSASSTENNVTLSWNYEMESDFQYHQVTSLDDINYTTENNHDFVLGETDHQEHWVNAFDTHDNVSENSQSLMSKSLHSGANLISFNVLPEDNSIENVMASIEGNATGVIGEGVAANYMEGIGWMGSLDEITSYGAYWLIVNEEDILLTTGYPTDRTIPCVLHAGANLISYPYRYPTSIEEALPEDIGCDISGIICEGVAAICTESGWVGSLSSLEGSYGCWFIAEVDMEITFNGCDEQECASLSRQSQNLSTVPEGYEYKQSTTQAFYFLENIENVEVGDWLLSFNGDEVIGARQWTGDIIDVPAMGSDGSDYTKGYIETGVAPSFKILRGDELINLEGDIPSWENNQLYMVSSLTEVALPESFSLDRAYPNPFNPTTTLSFAIPVDSEVFLSVYNLQGREVVSLVNGNMDAGYHSIIWNADSYSSGVYFVKMIAGEFVNTQKLMLVK